MDSLEFLFPIIIKVDSLLKLFIFHIIYKRCLSTVQLLINIDIHIVSRSFCNNNTLHHSPCHTRSSPRYICGSAGHDDTINSVKITCHRHEYARDRERPSQNSDINANLGLTDQCSPTLLPLVHWFHLKKAEVFG